MESYIDIDNLIQFFNPDHGDKIKSLTEKETRVFLSIYEFLDLDDEDSVCLENIQGYLSEEFTPEDVKSILEILEKKGLIFMPSVMSYQIYPKDVDDWEELEDIDWYDYMPDDLTSDLSPDQKKIKSEIVRKRFFKYYGYYEEDKEEFLEATRNKIRTRSNIDAKIKILESSELTFIHKEDKHTGRQVSLRVIREDNTLFSGVVFSLRNSVIKIDPNAGAIWNIAEYKEGRYQGKLIFYYPNGKIKEETLYNEGVEVSRKSYDVDGNEEKQNENVCYELRENLNIENLKMFASFNPDFLTWVVMDLSTKKVVFTSDSSSDCDQWISSVNNNTETEKIRPIVNTEESTATLSSNDIKEQKLPKWFTGEVYEKGGLVTNLSSGEEYELNKIELSMYDFVMGSKLLSEMGMFNTPRKLEELQKGLDWFRENNKEAYKILLE